MSIDAAALHADSPVLLAYMNPFYRCCSDRSVDFDGFIHGTNDFLQSSLPKLRGGGVDVIVGSFGINEPELFPGLAGIGRMFQILGGFIQAVDNAPDIAIARSAADLQRFRASHQLAVILHLTNVFLDGKLELLDAYHALGVRSAHPSFDTVVQPHPHDWKTGAGLTDFARHVVCRMDQLGMVIDLAHASDKLTYEVLELIDNPVMLSHTMCRALVDTTRNTPDELHKAIADHGGVIGIHFAGQLIDERYAREIEKTTFYVELKKWEAELQKEFPDPFDYMVHRTDYERWGQTEAYRIRHTVAPPRFDLVIDHIDHLVETIGIDHVGLGTDYDLGNMPTEVDSAEKLPNLTRALLDRGYTAQDIRKILGENFLRLFQNLR